MTRMTSVSARPSAPAPSSRPIPPRAHTAPARGDPAPTAARERQRPHLDELDRLRIVTALAVVGVHVISSTAYSDRTSGALIAQNAFVTALHFTREMFMFVTSFALVYVYAGRPFSAGRFWQRRAIGVLLPYAAWTLIYAWVNQHPAPSPRFVVTLLGDLLSGTASYQLYYILLTIEFYLLFPWFLRWLRWVGRHPWSVLATSLIVEVAEMYLNHTVVPELHLPGWAGGFLNLMVGRFVLTYQLYFVLGALAAQHIDRVRAFALRHGRWMAAGGVAALAALELHYAFALGVERVPLPVAVDVLQPIMVIYSLGAIAALYWWALWRVMRPAYGLATRSQRVWRTLADASFGVYLVHPLILTPLLADLVPRLVALPAAAQIALTWLLAAAGATAVSVAMMRLPILSRLVGRPGPAVSWRWLTPRLERLWAYAVRPYAAARPAAADWKRQTVHDPGATTATPDCGGPMDPITLDDYEALARACLTPAVFDTYAQGSDDELTLHANRAAYAGIWLRPRTLVDVRDCDPATTVLGTPISLPVLIAPSSLHRMAHPEGECATARAARAAGTVLVASTLSSYSLEEIACAADGSPLWFQLYLYTDRESTARLLARVERAGYRAIVLTVDAPYVGNRERDRRNAFMPADETPFGNFRKETCESAGADTDASAAMGRSPLPSPTWSTRGERMMLTWEDVAWLRHYTRLPLVLKGILTAEDTRRAIAAGVAGIIVSNHGGRQLDGTIPTIAALPEVVAAAEAESGGRCEIYVDGGIRRGTDVLKALALGARAVLIGRPALWGLAAKGEDGVRAVLEMLRGELTLAMRLAGRPTIASITRSLVTFAPGPLVTTSRNGPHAVGASMAAFPHGDGACPDRLSAVISPRAPTAQREREPSE